ncbi:S8 family serine peptidase [Methylosinus sp. sav-2]|uniref:S8 family serine peptidase n=1 Tax=Methylosinus sp. sav-2 TaxID=2485168 RepID=UPI001066824A|nr:S8 family serine peptidase [Methylosinus sp. sav-2]
MKLFPTLTDPQPNAPGGYGIVSGSGAFTASTPDINIDGIESVARNYIVTGNVNPARQTKQAKANDVTKRLDVLKDCFVGPGAAICAMTKAQGTKLSNIDPLVLDLNGDGITLSDWVSNTVLFNVLGDGRLHQIGWAAGGDGILALDLNGNGVIDNITETISAQFDWVSFNDSLDALASLAQPGAAAFSRATSQINWRTGNSYFDDLRVWVDANEDGVTDAGELKTLDELGIASISLQGTGNHGETIADNDIVNRTSFTRANGTTGEVASVDFEVNSAGATLTQLPGATVVRAYGDETVTSYVVTDNAGQWIDVSNFTLADGTHPDSFYSTTGNDLFFADPNDTRSYWLGGGTGSLTLLGGAGDDLLFINAATVQANIDGGGGFDIVKVNDTIGVTLDLAAAHVEEAIGDDGNDAFNASGMTSNAFLDGAGGNDILIGGIADDAITGNTGDDYLDGGAGNDVLRGGDGSDLIYGNEGDDIVYGEGGDDILVGGAVSGPNGANMLEGDEGNDLLIGTGGYSVASYRGSFADYTVTQNTDGTFTVADSHADRDGTDTLKDISTLNFADITNVALDPSLPTYGLTLPANDRINVSSVGPYVISARVVLANDKNTAGRSLSIRQLLDVNGNPIARGASGAAIGGTVALSTDGATITFTSQAGFTGVMKFKYQVQDSAGQTGLYAQQVGTSSVAEMAGTVFLDTPDHPTDEMFDAQWYLPEINVLPVWKDYTGAGVSIAVFDPSGNVDLTHPDLAANAGNSFKIDGSSGVEQYGMHATLVAGVIGAERNGEGVVGVAYDATISSVAIPTDFVDPDYIDLTRWRNYDVVNNSWTMNPAFVDNFLTNPTYENAYYSAVKYGRGGKGTVLVFAAGNDRGTRNTNDLNETNSLYGITVAGINAKTDLSSLTIGPQPFSTQGETILVSAPGSNIASTSEILTSSTGTVFGSDYATAEGTSFATPIVSGVVALMLEANPNLGYRDVQDILAYSARKVNDPATSWQINRATNWNGGGLHYSRDYGFGEVDARAAVRLAETWQGQKTTDNLLSRDASSQTGSFGNGSHLVEDYGLFYLWGYFFWLPVGAHVEYSNSFTASYVTPASDVTAEHVMIYADLDVDLYPIESLKVVYEPLVASGASFDYNGTPYYATNYTYDDSRQSILLDGEQSVSGQSSFYTGADGHKHLNFAFGSTKYRGEDWSGGEQWVLRVFSNGQEVAPSTNWGIRAFGASDAAPRQWIFTDELSSGSWITPQTSSDSFNASAATGNNIIDLRGGTTDSTINGWNIGVGGDIANGFGGDGNDTVHGNWEDNLLDGGRGDDLLTGDGGSDTFVFQASFGHDTISDFESVDMMRFDQTVFADWSQLLGAAQQVGADTVISVDAANTVTLTNVAVASLNQNQFQFV